MVGGGYKIEDRLLDVGGEIGEVDDLRHAARVMPATRAISAWSLAWPVASRSSRRIATAISLVM